MATELLADGNRPEIGERVARDIDELDGLIDELLLASRLTDPEALVLREPVDLLGLAAEEGARVGADVSGAPTVVDGDPRMLRRMVRNLLENARRHGGGTAIEADVRPAAPAGAVLRVMDRGPGIPEAERERIFQPFYRPAGQREGDGAGAGLGLALVRQIARRHGGDVRCAARPDGGTCFEVRLGADGA